MIVKNQRKTIDEMNKKQLILENQVTALKKKVEEAGLQSKKKAKELRTLLQQKLAEAKTQIENEKSKNISEIVKLREEVEEKDRSISEKLAKITELTIQNEGFKK